MNRWCTVLECLIPGLLLPSCERNVEPAPNAVIDSGQALAAQNSKGEMKLVRLLEPGAEPRHALRYRFMAQEPWTLALVLDSVWKPTMGELDLPEFQIPTLKLWVGIQPGPALPDASMRYTFRLDRTEVVARSDLPQETLEDLRAELGRLVGLAGSTVVDPRGVILETDAQFPEESHRNHLKEQVEDLRQQLLRLAVPLPEEPVGLGARWEARTNVAWEWMRLGREVFSFHGEQTEVYRLVSQEGDRVELEVEFTRVFPAQELVESDTVPSPGRLDALESKGTGHLSLDLQRTAPEASLSIKTHKKMTAFPKGREGPSRESVTDSTSKLTLRPQ